MACLTLTLFGGFRARLPGGYPLVLPSKKAQALLAYLAFRPGQPHPRDKLATLLWGSTPEVQARNSLRQTLFVLRRALSPVGPSCLVISDEGVALNPSAVEADVVTFEGLVAEGTFRAFDKAAALYEGDLLEGLDVKEEAFEEWLVFERERLRELALEVLAKLLAQQRQTRATERAIQTAVRLLALDPLQEVVHRALMRLYASQGRRGAALKQYQVCVSVLQRELRAEPEPETKQLYRDLIRQRPPEPTAEAPAARSVPRLQRAAGRSPPETSTHEAPLIGREPELVRLSQALDEAGRGQGRLALVVGEAGIGKSRLLQALATDANRRGSRPLLGCAYKSEQVLAFGLWVNALRTGQVASDVDVLDRLAPVWRGELARLLPEIGVPEQATVTRSDPLGLFEGIAALVRALAEREPLLLMLEDLHWADELSLRCLAFLARRIRDASVLVVTTMREEELGDLPLLRDLIEEMTREPHVIQLALPPLSRVQTTALVRALAPTGIGDAIVTRLVDDAWAVSDGNPFMVVETVRAFQEGTITQTSTGLAMPERVWQVIAGRLERLSDRSRQLASVAAVIGREFDFVLVQRAAGLDELEAAEGLEELVRHRVLHGVGEKFDFGHDRIRDVALSLILSAHRRVLHARVARSLEDLHVQDLEPHYAALGAHYREGEVWDRAARYLYRAGQQAVGRGAYREGQQFYDAAVDALDRQGQAGDLTLKLDTYLERWVTGIETGQIEDLKPLAQKAEGLAESMGDRVRLAQWRVRQAQAQWNIWDDPEPLETAVELALDAFGLADAHDVRTQSYALFLAGASCTDLGRLREAISHFDAGATLFTGTEPADTASRMMLPIYGSLAAWRSEAYALLGEFDAALASAGDALRVAEQIAHAPTLAFAYAFLGYVHMLQGEFAVAIPILEKGLAIGEENELIHGIVPNCLYLGYCQLMLGERERGLANFTRAIHAPEPTGITMKTWAKYGAVTVSAHLAAGQLADARQDVTRGLSLTTIRNARGRHVALLRLRAEIFEREEPGKASEAIEGWTEGLELAAELGMRPERAHCHLGLGKLYRRAGARQEAHEHLTTATTMYREMDMRFWLKKVEAEGRA